MINGRPLMNFHQVTASHAAFYYTAIYFFMLVRYLYSPGIVQYSQKVSFHPKAGPEFSQNDYFGEFLGLFGGTVYRVTMLL